MAKENKGVLKTWKDDRGFGFITPDDGSDDIFIHISALGDGTRRPYRGDVITYQIEQTDDGKLKAVNGNIERDSFSQQGGNKWVWVCVTLFVILASAVAFIFTTK